MSIIEKHEKWSNKSKEALLFMVAKYLRSTTNKKMKDIPNYILKLVMIYC